jgi:hypothetical protein
MTLIDNLPARADLINFCIAEVVYETVEHRLENSEIIKAKSTRRNKKLDFCVDFEGFKAHLHPSGEIKLKVSPSINAA